MNEKLIKVIEDGMGIRTNNLLSFYADKVHLMSGERGEEQKFLDPDYMNKRETDIKQLMEFCSEYPDITLLEEMVSRYKAQLQRIKTDTIPTLLFEAGMNRCELTDGLSIELKQAYNFKINGCDDNEKLYNRERLYQWFIDNGYQDILKTTFELGKGDNENIKLIEDLLDGQGASYKIKQDVHYKKIQATLKRHMEWTEKEIIKLNKEDEQQQIDKLSRNILPPEDIIKADIFQYAEVKRSE